MVKLKQEGVVQLRRGVTVERQVVSRDEAQEILARQNGRAEGDGHGNRKLDEKSAQVMADAWDRGEYIQTGDTLKFDTEGDLIDGQHRLRAVMLSGMATEFIVVRGLHPDAILVIDCELDKRTLADQLYIQGFANTSALAAVINGTWAMEQYGRPYRNSQEGQSMAQALDMIERRPSLEASAVAGKKYSRGTPFTARELGVLYEVMYHIDSSVAADFFAQIQGGYGDKGTPVVRLNQRINAHAAQDIQHSMRYVMALTIKAWNATLEGRKPRSLTMGGKEESFPAIVGFDKWLLAGGVKP